MSKTCDEWFRQAVYDMETARAMIAAGRNPYAVFLCHLALEKALKGLYAARLGRVPSRTHSIVFLAERVGLKLTAERMDFAFALGRACMLTRYPDDLQALERQFTAAETERILAQAEEMLRWLQTLQPKP